MKIARTVIGILTFVLFLVIMLQSCTANVVNAVDGNTTDASASGGVFVAFLMLIGGITGVVGKNSKKATLTAGIFYAIAALIGFCCLGTFGDLLVWAILSLIFAVVFVLSSLKMQAPRPQRRPQYNNPNRRPQQYNPNRRPQQRPTNNNRHR